MMIQVERLLNFVHLLLDIFFTKSFHCGAGLTCFALGHQPAWT